VSLIAIGYSFHQALESSQSQEDLIEFMSVLWKCRSHGFLTFGVEVMLRFPIIKKDVTVCFTNLKDEAVEEGLDKLSYYIFVLKER
jgi:hypothetical protein